MFVAAPPVLVLATFCQLVTASSRVLGSASHRAEGTGELSLTSVLPRESTTGPRSTVAEGCNAVLTMRQDATGVYVIPNDPKERSWKRLK